MKTAKVLREERAALITQMNELNDLAHKEKRSLSQEENQKWDKMYSDSESLKREYERIEKQDALNAELAQRSGTPVGENSSSPKDESEKRDAAFVKYMRSGLQAMNSEERNLLGEFRAQSTTSGAGGYTIPQGFGAKIIEYMKYFGGMRSAAYVFQTSTGNDLPFPTNDDTSNVGALLTEVTGDASASVTDLAFGQTTLKAYTYTTKLIKVSNQLVQDSHFDFPAYLAKKMAERYARIQNTHFTTGTGSNQPSGVVTGASAGKTAASATAITADEILDLLHAVDISYRNSTNARFMFNDNTLKAIRKLKDSNGRYLWQLGDIRTKEPDTIWGKPYTINQDMADIATTAKTILFGDFDQYFIRDVMDMTMLRLIERYAEYNMVAFVGFGRADGALMNTAAIKYLQQA